MTKIHSVFEERKCYKCLKELEGQCIDCLKNYEDKRQEHKKNIKIKVIENIGKLYFTIRNPLNQIDEYYTITYDKNYIPCNVVKTIEKPRTNFIWMKIMEYIIKRNYKKCIKKVLNNKVSDIILKKIIFLTLQKDIEELKEKDLDIYHAITIGAKYHSYFIFENLTPIIEIFS